MGSQFKEDDMFDSYHDDVAADEAAEECRRVELEAVSKSEGLAGWDDWGTEEEVYASIDAAEEAA